ncbi:hypothetical protein RC74_11135 [Falsihalocynthiibacter arcticus]|uniref:Uncharacterized protein n=1 Tax=Falsihalocynthiibacter arcticus TaxID=1579316 RepID=A0A126V086_9RHOB|nr:hypothetical protein RC74_11135 [Falsihalocynthiibacter arcticus]
MNAARYGRFDEEISAFAAKANFVHIAVIGLAKMLRSITNGSKAKSEKIVEMGEAQLVLNLAVKGNPREQGNTEICCLLASSFEAAHARG